jgi:hypothetical protein
MADGRASPLGALARGLAAGAVGTAAMTLHQELVSRWQSPGPDEEEGSGGDEQGDPWENAPVPALVAKRLLEGVFGCEVGPQRIRLLTNVMHWGYGIANGGAYGLIRGTVRKPPLLLGPLFGLGVWASSYVQLVPMGLYEPPWTYPPKTLANDVGYHLSYGSGTAAGYALVDRLA